MVWRSESGEYTKKKNKISRQKNILLQILQYYLKQKHHLAGARITQTEASNSTLNLGANVSVEGKSPWCTNDLRTKYKEKS